MTHATIAELVNIREPDSGDMKIYLRFESENYKDKERYIPLSQAEFNALVKLFVEGIVAKAKENNKEKDHAMDNEKTGAENRADGVGRPDIPD
jgi:hypothetical protein